MDSSFILQKVTNPLDSRRWLTHWSRPRSPILLRRIVAGSLFGPFQSVETASLRVVRFRGR